MSRIGVGDTIYELRKQIQNLSYELSLMDLPSSSIPQLINSANLLRSNDTLAAVNFKKSELILAYQQYSKELETMLENILEIQKELQEVLKAQTSMISEQKTTKKHPAPKKKSKK